MLYLKKKYPHFFKFLKFRQIKIIKIHYLWKKVILAYRNQMFTYSSNFVSKINLNTKSINKAHSIQKSNSKILKAFIKESLKQSEQSNQHKLIKSLQINDNQIIPKDDLKSINYSQVSLQSENQHIDDNQQIKNEQLPTFRTQSEWLSIESQVMNADANSDDSCIKIKSQVE
ncbi:hypothetical protein TTHERM_000629728 (macronuclear) [Tetrahymena thermophila SB210]|uniref:Uncharacterized protein n=1 Tax=Tetrahymena thermophila (strain SB210) TaxID=312017 RepID=W7X5A3_TETTS|nr:hypothetical protein TTHERM_000629728 [Tetrahymena thermophila SB210]EWS72582.1 hypothetical protein TTHERM_000629728 [Tetrahymena thermophila SB210]|eukprot:XP_012654865.1 hypothetical protein TTHERM_000629728 [Tetrahymena thermophila SB210]